MVKANKSSLLDKATRSRKIVNALENKMRDQFNKAKGVMLDEFLAHPVTEEINQGPDGSNISGTLHHEEENLFGFIGFKAGSNPIDKIFQVLSNQTRIIRLTKINKLSDKRRLVFQAQAPSLDDFDERASVPWPLGYNWVIGIERGIRGLKAYLSRTFAERSREFNKINMSSSRSGVGIELKSKSGGLVTIRQAEFKAVPYLGPIISRFISRFKQ